MEIGDLTDGRPRAQMANRQILAQRPTGMVDPIDDLIIDSPMPCAPMSVIKWSSLDRPDDSNWMNDAPGTCPSIGSAVIQLGGSASSWSPTRALPRRRRRELA